MAVITRANPSLETATPPTNSLLGGKVAGVALAALDAVYIKAADSKLYKCDATAADEKVRCIGLAAFARSAGKGVTVLRNVMVTYSTSLTPGTFLYLSATAGALQTTPHANAPNPVAQVWDAETIFVFGSVGEIGTEIAAMLAAIPAAAITAAAAGTPATAGGATPSAAQVDTAINTAVAPLVTCLNTIITRLETAGIVDAN